MRDVTHPGSHRPPGFRFSVGDCAVIIVVIGATVLLWRPLGEIALIFPIVLGHFFLFCNVFRLRRPLELIWAAVFVINLATWWISDAFSWRHVLMVQTPVTLVCIALEMSSSAYHGVGYAMTRRLRKSW